MPSPPVAEGHGATFTFTGINEQIVAVTTPNPTREALETTHLGTTGGKEFTPAALPDYGEITVSLHVNPDSLPPITGTSDMATIAFPDGAEWSCTAFVTGVGGSNLATDEITVADVTFKVSGAVTVTPAA